MGKKTIDYKEASAAMIKGFEEGRTLLVTSNKEGKANVMASGWGTIGTIWSRPILMVMVRPSRYSYALIEEVEEFTVNVMPPDLKEVVEYCGTVSGRDYDKIEEKKLTLIPSRKLKPPLIQEGLLHFECRTVYKSDMVSSGLRQALAPKFYGTGNFHRLYFGEILACYLNE